MPADLPPIGTRWGDLTDEQRAALPVGTVLGAPPRQPWWGLLIRNDGWRDADGNIVGSPSPDRPILSYPAPRPSTVTLTLTPALYARAVEAGMPKGERALAEWLVSRAEAAATARADALEEAARVCEWLVTVYCNKHGGGGDYATALADAALNIRSLIAKKEAP